MDIVNSMFYSLHTDNICRYHDINSYTSTISVKCSDYFNILHVNARFLSKNYDNLNTLLKSLPKIPDILCISETWLIANTAVLHEIDGFMSYHTHIDPMDMVPWRSVLTKIYPVSFSMIILYVMEI